MTDQPAPLTFTEPPTARSSYNRRGKHADIADQLRARPNEWALITTSRTRGAAGSYAHQIRIAHLIPYRPAGAFEAVARTVGGQYQVYARFVGHETTDPTT